MRSDAGARRREWLDTMSEQTWASQQAEEERQREAAEAARTRAPAPTLGQASIWIQEYYADG